MMVVGQPGFGKSWLLKKVHDDDKADDEKSEKLAWTKTAALNIGRIDTRSYVPQNFYSPRVDSEGYAV